MMVLAQPVNVEWLAIVVMVCLNVALAVATVDGAHGRTDNFAGSHCAVERVDGLDAFGVFHSVVNSRFALGRYACRRLLIVSSRFAVDRSARRRLVVGGSSCQVALLAPRVSSILGTGILVEVSKQLFPATLCTDLHRLDPQAPPQPAESAENASQGRATRFTESADSREAYHTPLTSARSSA